MNGERKESLAHVFIGGTGRCGTTLLKQIFAQHPKVFSLPSEFHFITDPGGLLSLVDGLSERWSPYVVDRALRDFDEMVRMFDPPGERRHRIRGALRRFGLALTPPRYSELAGIIAIGLGETGRFRRAWERLRKQLNVAEYPGAWYGTPGYLKNPTIRIAPRLTAAATREKAREFIRCVIDGAPKARGKTHWVDDSPANAALAAPLAALFPEAKLIHIRRHPFDVVASFLKYESFPKTVSAAAYRIRSLLDAFDDARGKIGSERIFELTLEELVSDPKGWIEKLCGFVNLEPDPAMGDLDFSHHHIGRNREELSDSDRELIRRILGPRMEGWERLGRG